MSCPKSPQRILLIASALRRSRGGQERSILEYREQLQSAGCEVQIAATGDADVPLDGGGLTRVGRTRTILRSAEAAALDARSEGVVVHSMLPIRSAHIYMPRGGLYPVAYERNLQSRPAGVGRLIARGMAPLNGVRRVLLSAERRILTAPDGPILVALSDLVANGAREHYGLPLERVRVVRNGVQLERLRLSLSPEEAKNVLALGAEEVIFLAIAENHRLKGIDELVRAFVELPKDRPARLRILGGKTRKVADPRIEFLGHRDDVPIQLLAADVLVHPTYYDPSSRVVLEAIAMQKPVITTEWNGAADFLRTGGGVVLRDPSDTAALRLALERLMDVSERKRMSALLLPRRRAISMERHVEEMRQVYTEFRP